MLLLWVHVQHGLTKPLGLFMNERTGPQKRINLQRQLHKFQCVQKEEKQFPRAIKGVFFTQGLTAFVGTH